MKIYGDSKYKGYLLVRDKKTNKVASKHYISSVDHDMFSDNVKVYVRGKQSDMCLDYKIGSNRYVDNGVRAWYIARKKAGMKVPELSLTDKNKLFKK